jgi:hypothetical protein
MNRAREVTTVSPAAKLVGFLLLLALVFAGARAAGARLGPLNTGRSPVQYSGGTSVGGGNPGSPGSPMSGMNGMNP